MSVDLAAQRVARHHDPGVFTFGSERTFNVSACKHVAVYLRYAVLEFLIRAFPIASEARFKGLPEPEVILAQDFVHRGRRHVCLSQLRERPACIDGIERLLVPDQDHWGKAENVFTKVMGLKAPSRS